MGKKERNKKGVIERRGEGGIVREREGKGKRKEVLESKSD